jgi:hypothetical protein
MAVMTVRAEGSADENAAGICVGRVSVVRIAIGVRIIRRRRVVTPDARKGYTNTDKNSRFCRRCGQSYSSEAQPRDKNYSESFQPTVS